MSSPRVKVHVYGLLWLSKRAYLTIQVAGVLLVVVAVALALVWPRPVPVGGHPLPPFVSGFFLFLDLFPWFSLVVLTLVALETHIVLGKFRREEARQRALAELAQSQESGVRDQESEKRAADLSPVPRPVTPDS